MLLLNCFIEHSPIRNFILSPVEFSEICVHSTEVPNVLCLTFLHKLNMWYANMPAECLKGHGGAGLTPELYLKVSLQATNSTSTWGGKCKNSFLRACMKWTSSLETFESFSCWVHLINPWRINRSYVKNNIQSPQWNSAFGSIHSLVFKLFSCCFQWAWAH